MITTINNPAARLVLASASPRRRQLLEQAGFSFQVQVSDIPEQHEPGEGAIAFATRLAREKAVAVFAPLAASSDTDSPLLVLGCDTVVTLDGAILGKPRDDDDAQRMLRILSGRTHQVVTGVAVVAEGLVEVAAEVTGVRFKTLSEAEIKAYVASGESRDKAGAYAIQGRAGAWVPRISGCYFNVVGLPLALVSAMLEGVTTRLQAAPIQQN